MKRSPIVDTSITLTTPSGTKVIIHDGHVPHPSRPDLKGGDIIIRKKGGYTCRRVWDTFVGKPCWDVVPSDQVELIAAWLKESNPEAYNSIKWRDS